MYLTIFVPKQLFIIHMLFITLLAGITNLIFPIV